MACEAEFHLPDDVPDQDVNAWKTVADVAASVERGIR
jgi:hypothetical protein